MKPVAPDLRIRPYMQPVVIAEDQPEYQPLPAGLSSDGLVLTEWELDADERAAIAAGARVRISVHTFGEALQPMSVEIVPSGE